MGNLTLTGYNPELGNRPYTHKRAEYAKGHFCLNGYFADAGEWNAAAIEVRGVRLADLAVGVWPDVSGGRGRVATTAARGKPVSLSAVVINGHRHPVSSMIDAAQHVFEAMLTHDPARFTTAVCKAVPHRRRGNTDVGMRTPRKVGDLYIDFHNSTADLQKRCHRLVKAMGLGKSAVTFESPAA